MKDKIIKEMAKSIDTIYVVRTTEIGEDWLNEILKERKIACAYKLYNAGYRKIPEGAVVLTREELWERDEILKRFETQIAEVKARKETAREILKEIGKTCGDYQWFKNLCKQYGVEVENGD